jgi:tRNA nucleotidyltransferase/poly(A) polymerase
MGATPPDWDVATSARPEAVQALFRRTVPVGVQFGVVRVLLKDFEYEVATLRADLGYSDGRRPDGVRFTDLREDVLRRDFTINGLALDPMTGEVTDLVGGVADLAAGILRAIGDADARFAEDRLRPLRAVRFAARTGFAIEEATYDAMRRAAADVAAVSVERISEELKKTLLSPRPGLGWRLLADTGMLAAVLPECGEAGPADPVAAALDAAVGIGDPDTLWAIALWPLGADRAGKVLRRLRQSNRSIRDAADTVRLGLAAATIDDRDVVRAKRILREPRARAGLDALAAWRKAQGLDDAPVRAARDRLAGWTDADLHPPRLATGDDALAAGIPSGPRVADALTALEDAQLGGDVTDADAARAFLQSMAARPAP